MRTASSFLCVGVLAAAVAPALAVTNIYTTQASFLANVAPGAYTEAFTRTSFAFVPSATFSAGGFSYTATATGGGNAVYLSGSFLGNAFGNQSLTLTFGGGGVTAVGGDFFITNIDEEFLAAPVSVTLSDGTSATFTPSAAGTPYLGFTSTTPITSLVMRVAGTTRFNTIDNLTVGLAAVVPEPGSYALMLAGLFALGTFAKRRR
jgi:hypothetical protein